MIDIGDKLLADILAARKAATTKMAEALSAIDQHARELGEAIAQAHVAADIEFESRMRDFRGETRQSAPQAAPSSEASHDKE